MGKTKGFFNRVLKKIKGWFDSESGSKESSPQPNSQNISQKYEQSNSEAAGGRPNYSRIAIIVLIILIGVFVLASGVFALGIYKYDWNNRPTNIAKETFPYPAAMVGLNSITINQVEQEADRLSHFFTQTDQGQEAPDEAVMKNQILERLVESQVVKNLAQKYSISVSSDEVDKQYQTIAEQNGGEEKLEKLLSELYNLNPAEFKELILRQLRMEELKQKFDNELRKMLKARHILVKVNQDANKKTVNKIRKKAEDILEKANKEGADFAKLAKKFSQDKASKDDGGQLPWFGKGDMVKSFEEVAFNLEIGQTSDLVRSQYGFHIIKLEDKRGEIEKDFTGWIDEMKSKWFVHKFIVWQKES